MAEEEAEDVPAEVSARRSPPNPAHPRTAPPVRLTHAQRRIGISPVSTRLTLLFPPDAQPEEPFPEFNLEWRTLAVVLDAGTQAGVDANAVEAALIDPDTVPWPVVDGRLNCFGQLTLAEMTEAAEAAVAPPPETEGEGEAEAEGAAAPTEPAADAEDEPHDPWKDVQLRIVASKEAHAASEDPDKGTWTLDAGWKHELFKAKSEVDKEAFRLDLGRRRRRALTESTAQLAAAEEEMKIRSPKLDAAQKAHEAALDAGEEPPPPEEEEPPEEGAAEEPDPDAPVPESALQQAQWAYDKVSLRLTEWREKFIAAKNDVQAPCRATKTYVLQADMGGTGSDNVDTLSELAAGGFPIRACVQIARAPWAPPGPHSDYFKKPADAGDDWTSPEPPTPEPADVPGKLTAKFIEARDASIEACDWDRGCRAIACVHAKFPRDADPALEPADMAKYVAEYVGYLAVADIEYQRWRRDDASLSHVPACTPDVIEATDKRVFGQLLAGVPHERATCAVVLDAMIGQVCANVAVAAMGGEDELRKARDEAAAAAAAAAIADALGGVKIASLPEVNNGHTLSTTTTTVGASLAATMDGGLNDSQFTGGMNTTMGRAWDGGDNSGVVLMQNGDAATTLRATYGPGLFARALRGDTAVPLASVVRLDPDEVEARMSALMASACAGADRLWMPRVPELDDDGYGARKTALRTFLPTPETPLQVLERHEMLTAAAAMLPPGAREEHGLEVRRRRHWEPLTREAYANLYSNAKRDLRGEVRLYHAPEDALVTLLHAPCTEETTTYVLQRAVDFREYMERYQDAVSNRKADEAEVARLAAEAEAARIAEEEEAARLLAESSMLTDEEEEAAAELAAAEAADPEPEPEPEEEEEDPDALKIGYDDGEDPPPEPFTDPAIPLVFLDRVGYKGIETRLEKLSGKYARRYPRHGSIVSVDPDGTTSVVAGGVTLGFRAATADGALTATLAGEIGASITITRAPDPPAPEPEPTPDDPAGEDGAEDGVEETRTPLLDESGNPVLDSEGNPTYETPDTPPPPPPPPISVQYITPSGLCVQVSSERTVAQKKPDVSGPSAAGSGGNASDAKSGSLKFDATELSRAVLGNGAVVRNMSDDGVVVMLPDGGLCERPGKPDEATGRGEWIGTNLAGTRWRQPDSWYGQPRVGFELPPIEPLKDEEGNVVVEEETGAPKFPPKDGEEGYVPPTALRDPETNEPVMDEEGNFTFPPDILIVPTPAWVDPVPSAHITDPDTGAVVTSRSDLTLVVNHPAPSRRRLVVHSDGTRVVADPAGGCEWRVEREGFAAVHAPSDPAAPMQVDLGASVGSVDSNGRIAITLRDGSAVAADASAVSGHVAYAPATSSADPASAALDALRGVHTPGVFVFDLVTRKILSLGDDDVDGFTVNTDGSFAPPEAFNGDDSAAEPEGADQGADQGAEGAEDTGDPSKTTTPIETRVSQEEGHVSAPEVKPRCFAVYPDQECYFEVLSEPAFAQYADAMSRDASCAVTAGPVAGGEPGVTNHTYLAPLEPPPKPSMLIDADAVPVAPPRPSRPSSAGPTLPSLKLPSKPTFPAPPDAMLVPRIAAFEAPKPRPAQPPAAFVFRQIVEYPPLTDQLSAWLDDSLAKFKTHSNADDSVTPDAYVLDDARGESFIAAERTLADRILAARVAKEEAYAERVAAEDATRLERERAEHEAAMEAAAEAQRNLKIAPPAKPRRPRTPPMFPPCGYFASEEGQGSYDTIRNMPGNPHGPIRSIPSPTKHRLHPAVKLADPEPTDPRFDEVYAREYTHEIVYDDEGYPMTGHTGSSSREFIGAAETLGRSTTGRQSGSARRYGSEKIRPETEYLTRPEGYLYRRREEERAVEDATNAAARRPHRGRTRVDYTGRRRTQTTAPRTAYYKEKASPIRNERYDSVPGNARRPVRTTSTALASHRGGGRDPRDGLKDAFELSPAHVHFGVVERDGMPIVRGAVLTNVGVDVQRFSLRQPESSGPFRVEFKPGMVSPGLAAKLRVVCDARGVAAGDYVGEAIVTTERQVFVLSLSARIKGGGSIDDSGTLVRTRGVDGVGGGDDTSGDMRLDETVSLSAMRGGR